MKQHREDAIFHEVTTTSCAAKALAAYSHEQKMDTRAVKAFGGQTGVYFVTATRKTHAGRERMKLRPWQIYEIVGLRDIITSKLVAAPLCQGIIGKAIAGSMCLALSESYLRMPSYL